MVFYIRNLLKIYVELTTHRASQSHRKALCRAIGKHHVPQLAGTIFQLLGLGPNGRSSRFGGAHRALAATNSPRRFVLLARSSAAQAADCI